MPSGELDPAAGGGVRLVAEGLRVRLKAIDAVGFGVAAVTGSKVGAAVTGSTVMAAVIGSKAEAVGLAVVAALIGSAIMAALTGFTVVAAMIGSKVAAALIGGPVVAALIGYNTVAGHAAPEDPRDRLFACRGSEPPPLFNIISGNFDRCGTFPPGNP